MRQFRSLYTDALTVHAGDAHVHIAPGSTVDLDDVIAPGVTLGDALGYLTMSGFEPVVDVATPDSVDEPLADAPVQPVSARRRRAQPVSDAPSPAQTQE